MSQTTSPAQPSSQTTPTTPVRNERPFLGELEHKFVIKLSYPIPG